MMLSHSVVSPGFSVYSKHSQWLMTPSQALGSLHTDSLFTLCLPPPSYLLHSSLLSPPHPSLLCFHSELRRLIRTDQRRLILVPKITPRNQRLSFCVGFLLGKTSQPLRHCLENSSVMRLTAALSAKYSFSASSAFVTSLNKRLNHAEGFSSSSLVELVLLFCVRIWCCLTLIGWKFAGSVVRLSHCVLSWHMSKPQCLSAASEVFCLFRKVPWPVPNEALWRDSAGNAQSGENSEFRDNHLSIILTVGVKLYHPSQFTLIFTHRSSLEFPVDQSMLVDCWKTVKYLDIQSTPYSKALSPIAVRKHKTPLCGSVLS